MKPWNETGEDEVLEQCPGCLKPLDTQRLWGCAECLLEFGQLLNPHHSRRETRRTIFERARRARDTGPRCWGVWVTGVVTGWCGNGKEAPEFSQGPWSRAEANELADAMSAEHPECRYEVREMSGAAVIRAETAIAPASTATILTLTPDGLKRVEPGKALYVDVQHLTRLLFEGDPDVQKLVAEKAEGRAKRLQGARDRAWELNALGKRSHYEGLVGWMLARRDPAGVAP